MAYSTFCIILLNKSPGVRPIGIGEVVHMIITKTVMKYNLQAAATQLCSGQDALCEAAVHALERAFAEAT